MNLEDHIAARDKACRKPDGTMDDSCVVSYIYDQARRLETLEGKLWALIGSYHLYDPAFDVLGKGNPYVSDTLLPEME